ncbi:hypothetical protein OF83DRAFT_1148544 [Amylostereum chailletii]|nr:hypothetical protein OF83DRAFT_1148544 [Amylostereum chailletii]
MSNPLPQPYHYIRLSLSPPNPDPLSLRRGVQEALTQTFGIIAANTYMDVLWIDEQGAETVLRTSQRDAQKVMAAVAASTGRVRMAVVRDSPFLPSITVGESVFGS